MHVKLVAKVNAFDTSSFVLKTKYHIDKSDLEKKNLMLANSLIKQIIMLQLLKYKAQYPVFLV